MNPFNRLPLVRRRSELIAYVSASDHKHVATRIASLPPASAMAICPSTLDAWLDCNAGEVSVFITTEELPSDAKTAFTAPKLLKKNKTARIDLVRYIALLPLLKTSMRNHERPLAYVTRQQMCQDRSLLGQSKKCENQEILGCGSLTRAIVEKKT